MITKTQLIVSCIFNGTNAIMLLYYIYDIIIRPIDLEHITRWSYYLNSVFTTLCLICDVLLYLQQDRNKSELQCDYNLMIDNEIINDNNNGIEKLNDWNRNKFSPICNSLSYFVLIGFWLLYFFGNNVLFVNANIRSWFNSYYHHLIISIIIIIDLFVSDRKPHSFSCNDIIIIISIYIIYCFIITVEKYLFKRNAYIFMENSSQIFLLFCTCMTVIFLFINYLIHLFLVQLKLGFNNKKENGTFNLEEINKYEILRV